MNQVICTDKLSALKCDMNESNAIIVKNLIHTSHNSCKSKIFNVYTSDSLYGAINLKMSKYCNLVIGNNAATCKHNLGDATATKIAQLSNKFSHKKNSTSNIIINRCTMYLCFQVSVHVRKTSSLKNLWTPKISSSMGLSILGVQRGISV